jgi:hypothetical protein
MTVVAKVGRVCHTGDNRDQRFGGGDSVRGMEMGRSKPADEVAEGLGGGEVDWGSDARRKTTRSG